MVLAVDVEASAAAASDVRWLFIPSTHYLSDSWLGGKYTRHVAFHLGEEAKEEKGDNDR